MFLDLAIGWGGWKVRILHDPTDTADSDTDADDLEDETETEQDTDTGGAGHTDATLTINADEYPPAFGFAPIPAPWDDEE